MTAIPREPEWQIRDGIHVYQGDVPIATFHQPLDAEMVVSAHNLNARPVLISDKMVQDAAQAIRDSNLTPPAVEAWRRHPQIVPAHVYAEAVLVSLFDQGYVIAAAPPSFPLREGRYCPDHKPVQRRDGKDAWCGKCGLTKEFAEPQSRLQSVE